MKGFMMVYGLAYRREDTISYRDSYDRRAKESNKMFVEIHNIEQRLLELERVLFRDRTDQQDQEIQELKERVIYLKSGGTRWITEQNMMDTSGIHTL